jgi:BMFP domain-containing protein YqiC
MNDLLSWAPIVVPTLAAGIGAWIAARHNRAASDHATDRTTDEKHRETEATTLVTFNHQLLDERYQLLARLDRFEGSIGGKVDAVQEQVTNDHNTNLRDDVTRALSMLDVVTSYLKDTPNMGDFRRFRSALHSENTKLRSQIENLEARFLAHQRGEDLPPGDPVA